MRTFNLGMYNVNIPGASFVTAFLSTAVECVKESCSAAAYISVGARVVAKNVDGVVVEVNATDEECAFIQANG
jgi:hypothetical protein